MTTPQTASEILEQSARSAAEMHADHFRDELPRMLEAMPTPAGTSAEVHAALDLLCTALEETARDSVTDTADTPAVLYGAALYAYALAFRVFLLELEPESPHRAAVLCITYAARCRDQASSDTPEAAAFLEGADTGTLTPDTAHHALNAFPDFPTLAAFLAAHHAFSLGVEALADPADTSPRQQLREALTTIREGVYTPSRAEA